MIVFENNESDKTIDDLIAIRDDLDGAIGQNKCYEKRNSEQVPPVRKVQL